MPTQSVFTYHSTETNIVFFFYIVAEECLSYFTLFPFFKNLFAISKSGKIKTHISVNCRSFKLF